MLLLLLLLATVATLLTTVAALLATIATLLLLAAIPTVAALLLLAAIPTLLLLAAVSTVAALLATVAALLLLAAISTVAALLLLATVAAAGVEGLYLARGGCTRKKIRGVECLQRKTGHTKRPQYSRWMEWVFSAFGSPSTEGDAQRNTVCTVKQGRPRTTTHARLQRSNQLLSE